MYAWYWINPQLAPAREQVLADLANPRVVGIKLHCYWHRFTAAAARPYFQMAHDLHKPLYLILGFGWLKEVPALLTDFPQAKVIFGYAGFPYFDPVWRAILPFKNAVIDLTSFHIDEKGIADALQILGPERCLFGTDCPYNFKGENDHFDYAQTLARIDICRLEGPAANAVLVENAVRLMWN
jgi:predicted TIM-barrel fold metal-dependent hydrolase